MAAALILAAACTSTHSNASTTAQTAPRASETTTTTAPPPMTTTVVTAPDNPFTATQIAQALLHLADAPPGFRLGPVSQSSALTSLCGKPPLLSAIPSVSQAGIVFVILGSTIISERVG
jgi:hypothetical protein